MKKFLTHYRHPKAFPFFLFVTLCLQVLIVSQAHANLVTDQKLTSQLVLIAVLVLAGEACLVTWLFRRRGLNCKYFGGALFIVNLLTWAIFFKVYRSLIANVYLIEASIVILEAVAIFYISRLPFIRSMSNKPVGILGAVISSVLGNLFSWGIGALALFLLIHFRV